MAPFPKTVAIIQARMGSTRLPGKVLMRMGNRTLLGYLVERLTYARTVSGIVVATTTNPRDVAIVEEARKLGVECFRGSETDVLERYVQAAKANDAEIVVRVTGDNPFTDPCSIDRVVDQLVDGFDYAIEDGLPIGTAGEALTFKALEFINRVAFTSRWREHVTLYAKENPNMLRCAWLRPRPGCDRPDLSFTVDHLSEYERVRDFCSKLPGPNFLLKDVIAMADTPIVV
jgi:spore coat polysaccharide biosynthesis protein SpsF (cytidylyltransferase family)